MLCSAFTLYHRPNGETNGAYSLTATTKRVVCRVPGLLKKQIFVLRSSGNTDIVRRGGVDFFKIDGNGMV